jgi:hypothetical protein
MTFIPLAGNKLKDYLSDKLGLGTTVRVLHRRIRVTRAVLALRVQILAVLCSRYPVSLGSPIDQTFTLSITQGRVGVSRRCTSSTRDSGYFHLLYRCG